jgi:hypothetical protein
MPTRAIIADHEERLWQQQQAAAEAAEADFLRQAEIQAKQVEARAKAPPKRPEPQARSASRLTRPATPPADSDDPSRRIMNKIEDHHHAFGAFLKYVEAAIVYERLASYPNDRDVDRALKDIEAAIQRARTVLDRRRCNHGFYSVRPGGDAYFGDELAKLHKLAYTIETLRQIFREEVRASRKAIRQTRSIEPFMRDMERQQLIELEMARFQLPDAIQQELDAAVGHVLAAARRQPQLLPEARPVALIPAASEPAASAIADRHADLRARKSRPAAGSVRQAVSRSPPYREALRARAGRDRGDPVLGASSRASADEKASYGTGGSRGLIIGRQPCQ